jgi:hypothetical protein
MHRLEDTPSLVHRSGLRQIPACTGAAIPSTYLLARNGHFKDVACLSLQRGHSHVWKLNWPLGQQPYVRFVSETASACIRWARLQVASRTSELVPMMAFSPSARSRASRTAISSELVGERAGGFCRGRHGLVRLAPCCRMTIRHSAAPTLPRDRRVVMAHPRDGSVEIQPTWVPPLRQKGGPHAPRSRPLHSGISCHSGQVIPESTGACGFGQGLALIPAKDDAVLQPISSGCHRIPA